jgi:hypothetical protein
MLGGRRRRISTYCGSMRARLHGSTCAAIWPIERTASDQQPQPTRRSKRAGGCSFVVDPMLDARDATPVWVDDERRLVRLIAMDDQHADCARFDLWKLSGCKYLTHDGVNLRVRVQTARESFHLDLDNELVYGRRYGYALPTVERLHERQKVITRFSAFSENKYPATPNFTLGRSPRSTLYHLRALQALDGVSSGASQRDIAGVLMGEDVVATQWTADSALRAQLRSLIHRARTLMNGGYRSLLAHNQRHAQGGIE